MRYWLFPCNPNKYKVHEAFNAFDTIEWTQTINKLQIGDIVFIYVGKPSSAIEVVCEVVDAGINKEERSVQDEHYIKDNELKKKIKSTKFCLLKKVKSIYIPLNTLKTNGLTGNIQSQRECVGQLLHYLSNRI